METDLYCLFCGSEMDYDIEARYAECLVPGCEAYFHLEIDKGCIKALKVATCGKECTCV